jgi:hypothetical protein
MCFLCIRYCCAKDLTSVSPFNYEGSGDKGFTGDRAVAMSRRRGEPPQGAAAGRRCGEPPRGDAVGRRRGPSLKFVLQRTTTREILNNQVDVKGISKTNGLAVTNRKGCGTETNEISATCIERGIKSEHTDMIFPEELPANWDQLNHRQRKGYYQRHRGDKAKSHAVVAALPKV